MDTPPRQNVRRDGAQAVLIETCALSSGPTVLGREHEVFIAVETSREGILTALTEQRNESGVEVDRPVPVLGLEALHPYRRRLQVIALSSWRRLVTKPCGQE